jgi:hypothetical protein
VKKLPLIGLILGAIAAGFALMRRWKREARSEDTPPPSA